MASFITVTEAGQKAVEGLKGQNKELLSYIINKYGVGTKINQSELILDFNKHQFDTEVLSKQSTSPISRLYEFYRSKHWIKSKWVTLEKANKGTSAPSQKFAKLEASFLALVEWAKKAEEIMENAGLEYPDSPVADEDDDVDTDATEDTENAAV
jgi:hypothetical protein